MKIYRIECVMCGRGPWTCACPKDDSCGMLSELRSNASTMPGPHQDPKLRKLDDSGDLLRYHFGFASEEPIWRYFLYSEYCFAILHRAGFELRIYDANECVIGDTQVLFLRKSAKLVDRQPFC